jgi:uncharacterized protein
MSNPERHSRSWRFYWAVTSSPKIVLCISAILVLAGAASLPRLQRDPSPEAFMRDDDPAVVYRDRVEEIFGLEDPMVVAVIRDGSDGVFTPETLGLVQWLTREIEKIEGVDPAKVTSLASEKNVVGTEAGFLVEPFLETLPESAEQARSVRNAVMDFPLYVGSLVARDGTATLVVAELLSEDKRDAAYASIVDLVKRAPAADAELLIAGPGAVDAALGRYIDEDQQRLNRFAFAIILAILVICYRTTLGVFVPLFIAGSSAAVALGTMAALNVPFYLITNSLSVILIAISVADSIHVLGEFYERAAAHPDAPRREIVVETMVALWRPITFVSITSISGFIGLGMGSEMPPMRTYGYFASIGVVVALLLSLFALPCALVAFRPRVSSAFRKLGSEAEVRVDWFGRAMSRLGGVALRHSTATLVIAGLAVVAGAVGAARLTVDGAFVEVFNTDEVIYRAEEEINRRMNGTNYIDVVIEAPEADGLLDSSRLARIEALQTFFEGLPFVGGTTSLVDYLKQMNRAMNENRADTYALPGEADLAAQYFLLYSSSGDPSDFKEIVSPDYRIANLRVFMNSSLYSSERAVIEKAEPYIQATFNDDDLTATLSGRATVHYFWIDQLAQGHFRGVVLSLLSLWVLAALSLRSPVAGFYAIAPVSMGVLVMYAVMGFGDIWLNAPTSMIAAIASGTGLDFALHTIDRLVILVRGEGRTMAQSCAKLFPSTGRAILFSFSTVALGFGVLATSKVPPLINFGVIVSVTMTATFLFTLTVLPVLLARFRPAFLFAPHAPLAEAQLSALVAPASPRTGSGSR